MEKNRQTVICCILVAIFILVAGPAQAETEYCTEITSLPYTINGQGIYCLKSHLATNMSSGAAITINVNNVIIDLNGYKIGNLAAGKSTHARGIYAVQRQNITIRNGTIRGFWCGIALEDYSPYTTSQGHLIEDIRADWNTEVGISVSGQGNTIRNNQVVATGGSPDDDAYPAGIQVFGPGNIVINNDVVETPWTAISLVQAHGSLVENNRIANSPDPPGGGSAEWGVYVLGSESVLVVNNRISNMYYGILYSDTSTGVYRDNLTFGCYRSFSSEGIDGGNNFP